MVKLPFNISINTHTNRHAGWYTTLSLSILIGIVAFYALKYESPILIIEMKTSPPNEAQIFFDTGQGYNAIECYPFAISNSLNTETDFAEEILRLYNNYDLLQARSQQYRQYVKTYFSKEHAMKKIQSILETLD
jgi:hypothetical protein